MSNFLFFFLLFSQSQHYIRQASFLYTDLQGFLEFHLEFHRQIQTSFLIPLIIF